MAFSKGIKPPKIFIDKGACPFECCIYRKWLANEDINLFSKIKGKKIIATIKKGQVAEALTGEVHSKPAPMEIVHKYKNYELGDKVYLLNYLGEGYQKVWFKGEVTTEEVSFLYNDAFTDQQKKCSQPSKKCWGKILGKQESTWWSKVKLSNGKVGWTDKGRSFSNINACDISEAELKAINKKNMTNYCKLIECQHKNCGCKEISSGWMVEKFCHGTKWKYQIKKDGERLICGGEKSIKGPIETYCNKVPNKSATPLKCG